MTELPTPSKFSLTNTLLGEDAAEGTEVIFTNAKAANALIKIEQLMSATLDAAVVDKLAEQAEELREQVKQSRYVFHLRGLSEPDVAALREELNREDSDKDLEWYSDEFIAKSLVKVVNVDGAEDTGPFDIQWLKRNIHPDDFARINHKAAELYNSTSAVRNYVDADFS